MQRLNWHITNQTLIRGVCTAALATPLVAVTVAVASASDKDSAGAVPHQAHTVQESVNDGGAVPPRRTKPKVELPSSGTGIHLGIAPRMVMVDLMTPWDMGYARAMHNARRATSSPWGHWWWVQTPDAFRR